MNGKLLNTDALTEIKNYIAETQLGDALVYSIDVTSKIVWLGLFNNYIIPKLNAGTSKDNIIVAARLTSSGWGPEGIFFITSVTSSNIKLESFIKGTDVERYGNSPSSKSYDEFKGINTYITITLKDNTATDVSSSIISQHSAKYLNTNVDYPTIYQPKYAGSPATKQYVDDKVSSIDDSTLRGRKVFYLDNTSQLTPSFIQEIITTGSTIGYNNIILIISHFFTDRRCGIFTYSESVPLEGGVGDESTVIGRCERFIGVHYSSIESFTENGLTTTTAAYPMLDIEFDNDGNFTDYHMTFAKGDRAACFLSPNANADTFVPTRANDPANKDYVDKSTGVLLDFVTPDTDDVIKAKLQTYWDLRRAGKSCSVYVKYSNRLFTLITDSIIASNQEDSYLGNLIFNALDLTTGRDTYGISYRIDRILSLNVAISANKVSSVGAIHEDQTHRVLSYNGSFPLGTNNIAEYVPTDDYNPSTKKYVDDVALTLQRKPEVIYSDPTGFEASNDDVGDTWHLENLDLSKYKRLKFYVKPGGDTNDNRTPSHVVEMHLDDRAKGSSAFTAGHMSINPNNRNRIHCVTFAVNNAKTAIQFVAANSLYGTASTSSSGGRTCYLIEGYYD